MEPTVQEPALDLALAPEAAVAPAADAVQEAVLRLFDAHRDGMFRYVRSVGIADEDCEDIVQEVFLALFHHLARGRPRTNLRGWVFRVAHNLALRHRAREMRRRRVRFRLEWRATVDTPPSPEDRYLSEQLRTRLLAVANALPVRDRRCLQLRAEGLRYREIAHVLGVSLGTVANTMARALARLRRAEEG